MKQTGHFLTLVLAMSFSIYSCHNIKSPNKGNGGTIALDKQNNDLLIQFDNYFKDKNQIIPFPLYTKVTSEKLDTSIFSNIQPMDRIKNGDCIFYITKLNCLAGGDCAEYKLISICNLTLNSIKTIGIDRADAEFRMHFSYNIVDSTMIELIREEEKYNDDFETISDTIIKTPLNLKK